MEEKMGMMGFLLELIHILHPSISYLSEDIQGTTVACFLLICKVRVVALPFMCFHDQENSLTSLGQSSLGISPCLTTHVSELCVREGPLHSPTFCRLV